MLVLLSLFSSFLSSFHEMGYFDLPAEIDFILNKTDHTQMIYIGHSMGTTMFYVLTSQRPEYNEKLLGAISLAPVAYLSRTRSPIRYLAPFALNIEVRFGTKMFTAAAAFISEF